MLRMFFPSWMKSPHVFSSLPQEKGSYSNSNFLQIRSCKSWCFFPSWMKSSSCLFFPSASKRFLFIGCFPLHKWRVPLMSFLPSSGWEPVNIRTFPFPSWMKSSSCVFLPPAGESLLHKASQRTGFVLNHFLGTCPVQYNASGWLKACRENPLSKIAPTFLQDSQK